MARILVLAGDGIGPEITPCAVNVLERLAAEGAFDARIEHAAIGGSAIDVDGVPLPDSTLNAARDAHAILLGAVGGPKWDELERALRPEQGLLRLRSELGVFANLRPALTYPQLTCASTLKHEVVAGLDLLILRELTGGIYFGQPRGVDDEGGVRVGYNTLRYTETEIERIVRVGFELAAKRAGRLCSVDKANVLEVSGLWREVANRVAADYPKVELTHLYVDNAAMQLVRAPKQFDVIVTSNMFGDILSDLASMLTGSIGMLPSAAVDAAGKGLYEPIHGAAPDIAGRDVANPLAMILSVAMMLRYTFDEAPVAERIERAVAAVLEDGYRTADIVGDMVGVSGSAGIESGTKMKVVGTQAMGAAVVDAL